MYARLLKETLRPITEITLWAGWARVRISATAIHFSLLQKRPFRLWGPLILLFNGYRSSVLGIKRSGIYFSDSSSPGQKQTETIDVLCKYKIYNLRDISYMCVCYVTVSMAVRSNYNGVGRCGGFFTEISGY